ncbi:hypothetical protein IFM12276_29620 [Nocardia sputorum]|uniref:Uncharacterized protein n=1 Tax=Nocardia sputorum TaxID=2984338 RepID=A0ABM8CY58_9NOCA|nr:hypothetical protein IFM12276_29620 [Nocardia sputorum]
MHPFGVPALMPGSGREERGTNRTWRDGLCGVPLSRARLARFPHVPWSEALWLADTSGHVIVTCRRCAAAGGRESRRWTRSDPRP